MNIAEHLRRKGTSLKALAEEVGMNKGALSRIINGRREPTFRLVVQLYASSKGQVSFLDWVRAHKEALKRDGVLPEGWEPPARKRKRKPSST